MSRHVRQRRPRGPLRHEIACRVSHQAAASDKSDAVTCVTFNSCGVPEPLLLMLHQLLPAAPRLPLGGQASSGRCSSGECLKLSLLPCYQLSLPLTSPESWQVVHERSPRFLPTLGILDLDSCSRPARRCPLSQPKVNGPRRQAHRPHPAPVVRSASSTPTPDFRHPPTHLIREEAIFAPEVAL